MARILIADDSELMQKQLVATVENHPSWSVCGTAANGVSAILKAHELKPDLVILDLVMPMLDGLQTAAEIAKLLPTVPIVIFSVQILPELEMEAKKYGVSAMISKSAEQNQLIETIERLLASPQSQLLRGVDTAQLNEAPSAPSTAPIGSETNVEPDRDPSSELN
jgi:DNA-binding NarL/FixJ family response regulator